MRAFYRYVSNTIPAHIFHLIFIRYALENLVSVESAQQEIVWNEKNEKKKKTAKSVGLQFTECENKCERKIQIII